MTLKNTPAQAQDIVMVVGMPRSGTTWIAKMLDASPETLYLHEPDAGGLSRKLPIFIERNDISNDFLKMIHDFYENLPYQAPLRCFVRLPLFQKAFYRPLDWLKIKMSSYAEKIHPKCGQVVKYEHLGIHPKPFGLVLKSVESFGRIPVLLREPRVRGFVYIMRHPGAVYYSVTKGEKAGKFKDNKPVTVSWDRLRNLEKCEAAKDYDISFEKLLKMGEASRFAYWWVISNEKALRDLESHRNVEIVIYENVCEDPLGEARKIYDRMNLRWSPEIEKRIMGMSKRHDNRYYSVMKMASVTKTAWKDRLNDRDRMQIEAVLSRSPLHKYWASA